MARKIYYRIPDDGHRTLTEGEWGEISRLEHWYNSEFIWTSGRLALKRFAVFLNYEGTGLPAPELKARVDDLTREYAARGISETETLSSLEREGLLILKPGGYLDDCLGSGWTRVAGNEFNAFLVCDFLLKVSVIAPGISIEVIDEGEFIKSKQVIFLAGSVHITVISRSSENLFTNLVRHRHVFSIVDAQKYDRFPSFQLTVPHFNDLSEDERKRILRDYTWLGYEHDFDLNGDDIQGYNLNEKVRSFHLISSA
jgi:hypothetical protein